MPEGLFGRIQKTTSSIVKRAQLYEKSNWWWSSTKSPRNRFGQFPLLKGEEDLKHTLSNCLLWVSTSDQNQNPKLWLSYKLFDRWISKDIGVKIDNWKHYNPAVVQDAVLYSGFVSQKHFRLIDSLSTDLIPRLKEFIHDVTWSSALYNPKLQVQNLNAVVVHCTNQGVELSCYNKMQAYININVKSVSLQLVMEREGCYLDCSNLRTKNIKSLSEGIATLRSTALMKDIEPRFLEASMEQFILETLENLDPKTHARDITTTLQSVLSSINRFSQEHHSSPSVTLWIQFGITPRLICLLMDHKRCTSSIFQLIKNIFRGFIHNKVELASKAIVLYICRALERYGLHCRAILVLITSLMEIAGFRKIAIEQFDLGQNFGRLLLVGKSPSHLQDPAIVDPSPSAGFMSSSNQDFYPSSHLLNEQQHLPIEATLTWRVPPVPLQSNPPPEDALSQISILKNLLLLSPLNNEAVCFRTGHLVAMLIAFIDCGLAQHVQDQSGVASSTPSARELDDAWFFVFRLALANIHEHCYHHPSPLFVLDDPQMIMVKPRMELKTLEEFIKQVLVMVPFKGSPVYIRVAFKLMMELIVSTPSPMMASLVALNLSELVYSVRLSPTQIEVHSESKSSAHLALFSLLIEVLKRIQPCPYDLLKALVSKNIVKTLFQIIEYTTEQKELNRMEVEEAVIWIQKCWRLLTTLVTVFHQSMPEHEDSLSLFNQIEIQFIHKLTDPFCFDSSNSVYVLASLEFLQVYLNHQQCLLYKHEEFLVKILTWLRETLNRSWNDKDSDLSVGCLEVVAVVCANISNASPPNGVLHVFIDGLLNALNWISSPDTTEKTPQKPVHLEAIRPEKQSKLESAEGRGSQPGPSRPPGRKTKRSPELEIQPDPPQVTPFQEASSSFILSNTSHLRSFPVGREFPSPQTSSSKLELEHFRLRHETPVTTRRQFEAPVVIPPLNLRPSVSDEVWYMDQRSVGSTEYSSELPARPLSQISDLSGFPSSLDRSGSRQLGVLSPADSSLIETRGGGEVRGRRRAYTAPLQYLDHDEEMSLESAKQLFEKESSKMIISEVSTQWNDTSIPHLETDLQPGKLILGKRANSASAMVDLAAIAAKRSQSKISRVAVDSSSFHRMHSYDNRPSRQSIAMQQLIGERDPVEPDLIYDEIASQDGNKRGLSHVMLDAFEMENNKESPFQISEGISVEMDVLSGTNMAVLADSEAPELCDLDVELLFNEKVEEQENSSKEQETNYSVILASKYRLSTCKVVLDDHRVHITVLKVFLKLLLAEYSAPGKEQYLSRVISLALHNHFHYLPKTSTLLLKDWAIQQTERGYYYLMKLLCRQLFDEGQYLSLRRIGRGVFSSIHECICPVLGGPANCCAKVVDLPTDPHDIRSFKDLFNELIILHRLQKMPRVVTLYDFGCTKDSLYLITKLYKTDLQSWRKEIGTELPLQYSKMMFKIFLEILKAVDSIHQAGVVHFDLKCSNIVLDFHRQQKPRSDAQDNQDLPFHLILADFGEALLIENISHTSHRSRGTQAFMSPEVLVAGSTGGRIAPSVSSDVWSLGCLLFELITGQLLFDDSDYSEFHTRLTTTSRTLIDSKRVELIPEGIREPTLLCLSYLLVRNPAFRAPLRAVIECVEYLLVSNALPDSTSAMQRSLDKSARSGFTDYMISLPEQQDLELRAEFVPISPRVCILSLNAARDPWTLSQHHITHVVFVHFPSEEDSTDLIRNSALRATAVLIQIQLPVEEEEQRGGGGPMTSLWTDRCRRCCEFILTSIERRLQFFVAIVPGHKTTNHYVEFIARQLSSHQGQLTINLDSCLMT
eukprot:g2284.t1